MEPTANHPTNPGMVSLVGAGPGHPDLLTLKGARLLAQADVIVHDALLHPDMLALFPPRAEAIFVGKRAGQHTAGQQAINEIIIAKAREGKRVVRLKGGDPFIFGRGGEEVLALTQADIPVEVVPGVSALNGAATSALLPLTHRGSSDSLLVLAGCDPGSAAFSDALSSIAKTVAVFMAGRHASQVAATALGAGWSGTTPAALVWNGGRPDQIVWKGDLETLSKRVEGAPSDGACIIYFGMSIATLPSAPSLGRTPREGKEEKTQSKILSSLPSIDQMSIEREDEKIHPEIFSSPPSLCRPGKGAGGLGFPIWLQLSAQRVLIVGGGSVALQKIRSLQGTRALIDVVALETQPELDELQRGNEIRRVDRRFVERRDLEGARLVISACNDRDANAQVAAWAGELGIWVNSVDDPSSCTFLTGALLTRGPIRLGLSTDGHLPGLSGLMRRVLEGLLPEAHDDAWIDLEVLRARLKTRLPSSKLRMGILREALRQLETNYFGSGVPTPDTTPTRGTP